MSKLESKSLLEDLFADEGTEQFRASAMSAMLGAVQRKKRVQKIRSVVALALGLLATVPLTWWLTQPAVPVSVPLASRPRSYELVTTGSLPLGSVVDTQSDCCPITTSRTGGYAMVESLDSRGFVRQLDDEGLLSFFAGRPVALVQRGPGVAELIIADESLRNGFRVQ